MKNYIPSVGIPLFLCIIIASVTIGYPADVVWPKTPINLLKQIDTSRSGEPNAWVNLPDGSLRLDAGYLKATSDLKSKQDLYELPIDGDFTGPYKLEMEIEVDGTNETLSVLFPVGGRRAHLRLNVGPRGNSPCTVLHLGKNLRHDGLLIRDGERKLLSVSVVPTEKKDQYSAEILLDDEKIFDFLGFIGPKYSQPLDHLRLTAWPHAKWKFHKLSLFIPGCEPEDIPVSEKVEMFEVTTPVEKSKPAAEEGPPAILRSRVARYDEAVANRALAPYRKNMGALCASYDKAIERAISTATKVGNLTLVLALGEEKKMLKKLSAYISESDPESLPTLPPLPQNAATEYKKLRQTWKTIRKRHGDTYRGAVAQLTEVFAESLKGFETELTIAEKISEAKLVRDYRLELSGGIHHLAGGNLGGGSEDVSNGNYLLAGQYEAVPLDKPFPMPLRRRPTEPCRVVAWRIDGEPVDPAQFRKFFYSVPDRLGEVVDIDMSERMDRGRQMQIIGLTRAGKVRTSYAEAQSQADHIVGAVQVAGERDVGIALLEDQTCRIFSMHRGALGDNGWRGDLQRSANWKNLVSVDTGERHVVGLTADGAPLAAGDNCGDQNAVRIPFGFDGRTCRLVAQNTSTRAFALDGAKTGIEAFDPRLNKVVKRIPRANRFFNFQPRLADQDGDNLDMNSGLAHAGKLVGRNPGDVTYARAIGGRVNGEAELFLAAIREGDGDWRFWGDLGRICSFDQNHCRERAQHCRKLFLNPPYMIGLKPVAALTEEDWTGTVAAPVNTTMSGPVEAIPRYRNIFPLPIPERSKVRGTIEVFRRDGKPLDTSHTEVSAIPADLGNNVVEFHVATNPTFHFAIALLDDGTVRSWGNVAERVDLSHLKNIVSVRAGFDKVMTLDENGNVSLWTRGGIRQGRFNDANEPVSGIAMKGNDAFVITAGGKVYPANEGPKNWMAKDLPPCVDVVAGHWPYALGIDGKWRTWSVGSNFRSKVISGNGTAPRGYHASGDLWWIDKDQMLHRSNRSGLTLGTGDLQNTRIERISGSNHTFTFFESVLGRWTVWGGSEKERDAATPKIQKSLYVTGSSEHIFCLKPWGG